MTQIDWSKAPEGATHFDARGNCCSVGFMKPGLRTGEWEYFGIGGHWILYGILHREIMDAMVERPKAQDWTGEGRPPVGIDVEIHNKSGRGVVEGAESFIGSTCKVMATFVNMHGYEMVSVEDSGGFCMCFRADMCGPIRTPAQLAAEEREKAIEAMNTLVGDIDEIPTWTDALAKLYDAGYRKVEVKP